MKNNSIKAFLIFLLFLSFSYSNGENIGKNLNCPFSKKIEKIDLKTVQCKAIAKSTKKRCKNKTTNPSGYCRVHGG